nr:hypothetical protein [Tanacetum cinerariifolium]
MTSFGYRLNPRYAIKECSDFCCSKGSVEDKILVPKLPKNCARCGHPVDGLYCQGCSLLRKKLEEDLVTYLQDFQNTSESSDDSTNVVNAPRYPFVVKQDHGVNSSQNPPHVDECCCECGDALDGIFCQQCTCKSCGKGAHIGYNCLPKVSIISSPELVDKSGDFHPQQYSCCDNCGGLYEAFQCQPMNQNFYNSNSLGFDQTQPPQFPVIHPPPQETSIKILHDQENAINSMQTFLRKFNCYSFFETPKVLSLAWDRVFEIKVAFGNKQYKPEDMQELFRKLFNDVQNIHEELAEYINTPGWNRAAFYNDDDDDDVDYTIAITPVLSTKEPDNSLSIPNTMCDVHLVNNPTPLEAKNHFEIVINSNDDYSSSDDDYLYNENAEYVKASPHDSELVSLESSSTSPKSFLEETNTFHNSLPEFEIFCFDLEEISSGSTTTHSDISLPDYEAFYFYDDYIEEISSGSATTHSDISLSEYDSENLSSTTRVNLPVEDDHSPLLAYVVWIFLACLT